MLDSMQKPGRYLSDKQSELLRSALKGAFIGFDLASGSDRTHYGVVDNGELLEFETQEQAIEYLKKRRHEKAGSI